MRKKRQLVKKTNNHNYQIGEAELRKRKRKHDENAFLIVCEKNITAKKEEDEGLMDQMNTLMTNK